MPNGWPLWPKPACNKENSRRQKLPLRQILTLHPDNPETLNNLGTALAGQGQSTAARAAYQQALTLRPDFAEPHNNIGNLALEQGDLASARLAYEQALKVRPDDAQARTNLGVVLHKMGDDEAAVAAHRAALLLAPDLAETHYNLALALMDLGLLDQAIAANRAALTLRPDHAKACNNLGLLLQEQGDIAEATKAFRRALTAKPDYFEAFLNLSRLTPLAEDDPLRRQMQALYDSKSLSEADLCPLCFALAHLYDPTDPQTAFAYLREGNALRKSQLHYAIDQDRTLFAAIKQTTLVAPAIDTEPQTTPIFVLGMPRSGTTLIEQILSSHPDVAGAGELDFVARLGADLAQGKQPATQDAVTEFRRRYLNRIAPLAEGRRFVTDKTPHNFLFLGLILTAFPEAKVVHVTRDPAATCWSNYWWKFTTNRIGYNYDLTDVVDYFGLYQDLMAFWVARYPGRIITADYDALTRDQTAETHKLINGLGLPWHDACLSPESNPRAVKTASNVQIRRAVYQGSSQKWRRYEPYLNGAFDRLPKGQS